MKNCYAEDVLNTSSRHVLRASSRRLEDQQIFSGITLNAIYFFLSSLFQNLSMKENSSYWKYSSIIFIYVLFIILALILFVFVRKK